MEGRQKEWSAEAERRHEALWSKVMREREAAHAEMTKALEALDARRRQLAVDRVLAEDEFNKGVPEARSAVVRRVKEVTRKFDGQMDAQLDSCSRTKAVVDAHRLTLASAKRARRTAMDRLTRDLRMREHEWDKERKGERRQLAQLQEDMERAQQDLEMRRGETGADLEERREQLKLQVRGAGCEMCGSLWVDTFADASGRAGRCWTARCWCKHADSRSRGGNAKGVGGGREGPGCPRVAVSTGEGGPSRCV